MSLEKWVKFPYAETEKNIPSKENDGRTEGREAWGRRKRVGGRERTPEGK